MGGGTAVLDLENDGDLDLVLFGPTAIALYRNDGRWRFTDITGDSGLRKGPRWMGCATGDYDNDGDLDLVLTAYNDMALYRNDFPQRGQFVEVTDSAGISREGWNTAAAFLDLDGDGRLDLYIARYVEFSKSTPQFCDERGRRSACGPATYAPQFGAFYRNRGGVFQNETQVAGFADTHGKGLGAAVGDFNDDGRADLYVANDVSPGDLFENLGGRVRNVGKRSGTALTRLGGLPSGMGTDWGDYDGDGRLDLVVGTFEWQYTSFYRNVGDGVFLERGLEARVGVPSWMWVTFTTRFFDYDNDGRRDLLITNGHIRNNAEQVSDAEHYRQPTQLLHNEGNGGFEDKSPDAGAPFIDRIVGRGAATGDLDNDGDEDVVLPDLEGPAQVLENTLPRQNRWIGLRLVGTRSPRDGQGAQVKLKDGKSVQVVTCTTSGGFFGAHDPRVHFGLGRASKARRVEIRWSSGRHEAWSELRANRVHTLREGTGKAIASNKGDIAGN
jgi:hypothetical protein